MKKLFKTIKIKLIKFNKFMECLGEGAGYALKR